MDTLRVAVIEKEMDALLESRMKELSANDMEVWVFDTKRNSHVQKGRLEQEQAARKKEESILDLELDFLAPYFQRFVFFKVIRNYKYTTLYLELALDFLAAYFQ